MGNDDEGVLAAARAIRCYLPQLVGPAAAVLDSRVAELLNAVVDRRERVSRLRTLLNEHPDTSWFLGEVLADAPDYRPPYQQPRHRRRQPMPTVSGDPGPVPTDLLRCPYGDFDWYLPEVGTEIPDCPTHQVSLARS